MRIILKICNITFIGLDLLGIPAGEALSELIFSKSSRALKLERNKSSQYNSYSFGLLSIR